VTPKPPPLFRPFESIRITMTPKVLRVVVGVLLLLLGPPGAIALFRPTASAPQHGPAPIPGPVQEWTTVDSGALAMRMLPGSLPEPDPRQKHVPCKKTLGQVMLNGACWQLLPVPPPCPLDDGAFEHDDDHKCYTRVLRAERPKQSGDPQMVNVAGGEP
jgi:hypothetical protein